MKITKRQLRKIIHEEKEKLLSEDSPGMPIYNDATRDLDYAIMIVMRQLMGDVGYSEEEAQEAIISYVTEKVTGEY